MKKQRRAGSALSAWIVLGLGALGAAGVRAEIAEPAKVLCTVTKVTPEKANFFGFGPGPLVGDTTPMDLNAAEIGTLTFASGAHIGPTVHKHDLVKQPTGIDGFTLYEVSFTSQSNGKDYRARLIADENRKKPLLVASIDVVETAPLGRLRLHSVELSCARP